MDKPPSDKPLPFRLDLVDKVARQDASQKSRNKNSGILISVHAPTRTSLNKEPKVIGNPWKAAPSTSTAFTSSGGESAAHGDDDRESTAPAIPAPESGEVTLEKPAELAYAENNSETAKEPESEDDRETIKTGKPTSPMEVFMAAKKRGRPPKKSSASIAMGDALDRQEKKSSAIEKMLDKNIAAETSRAKSRVTSAKVKTPVSKAKPRVKRALADIVSEVVAKKGEKKAAPRAAKAAAKTAARPVAKAAAKVRVEPKREVRAPAAKAAPPKPRPQARPTRQARPVRAASGPVDVVVESLATGLVSLLSSAVGGVMGAGKVAGQAMSTGANYVSVGTRSATEKVKSAVKPGKGSKAKHDEGSVAAAAKTATRVTKNVAEGLSSVASGAVKASGQLVSGVAAVAGYTVKGAVAIVNDTTGAVINTVGGLLNMLIGSKKKRRRTA